jgi:hypothetical protein
MSNGKRVSLRNRWDLTYSLSTFMSFKSSVSSPSASGSILPNKTI